MTHEFDVIIAGAGPAGLATARALSQRDHRILVLEAQRLFQPKKVWLTFGEVARKHKLEDAVRLWCDRGSLIYHTGGALTISRRDLVAVFDERKLLRLLADQMRNGRVVLRGECPVMGFRRGEKRPNDFSVRTPHGEFFCKVLVDASGGHLQWDSLSGLSVAYYTTYARIYEGCSPRLPLNEIVLLHKAYPGQGTGQWSSPISDDQYLLGEVNFSTRGQISSLDFKEDRADLARRLDFYTWQVQDFVVVPPNAPYKEYYGVVPVWSSPPKPRQNILTVDDSAFQARPFFGVSVDQLLDQADAAATAVTSCFENDDFSAERLSSFTPQQGSIERLNFRFGWLVWRVLEVGPDSIGGKLCSALEKLDESVKYNMLRGRLRPGEISTILRRLKEEGFFRHLNANAKIGQLLRYYWEGAKLGGHLLVG